MGSYCGRCGSLIAGEFSVCERYGNPAQTAFPVAANSPASYAPKSAAAALAMASEPAGLAPIAPLQVSRGVATAEIEQLQGLHSKVLAQGDSIAQSFGAEPTGFVKIIAWMVRSTFLDKKVARAAAEDTAGNGAAIAALAIIAAPGIVFGMLFAGFRMGLILGLVTTLVVTAVTLTITFFSLSMLSEKLVDIKMPIGTVLRVLAYPQTISVLGSIPILGSFIGPIARIWSIVASAEAVREVTGTKAEKAVIFAAIGALIQACVWMVLSIFAARMAMLIQIR